MKSDTLYDAEYENFMLLSHVEEMSQDPQIDYAERLRLLSIAQRLREIDTLLRVAHGHKAVAS